MKAIYKYSVKDFKDAVLVELETEGGQTVKASRTRETAKGATGNLDEAFAKLQPMIPTLATALKTFAAGSKSSEIAFGIKLTIDGDALITLGQSEANFVITVRQS